MVMRGYRQLLRERIPLADVDLWPSIQEQLASRRFSFAWVESHMSPQEAGARGHLLAHNIANAMAGELAGFAVRHAALPAETSASMAWAE